MTLRALAGDFAREELAMSNTTLKSVKWGSPARRVRLGREAQATKVAARWARNLMGGFSKVAAFLLETKAYMAKTSSHATVLSHLAGEEQAFLRGGIRVLRRGDFEEMASKNVERCKMSRAHRITETKELQSVLASWEDRNNSASPHRVCDREMVPWAKIWRCHDLQQLELPGDAAKWPALPAITVSMMRQAFSFFSTSTASGPGRIGVRAFLLLSDEGLYVLAALFERCEDLLAWAGARVWREMVRLPKPSGGRRLIALMDSMIRIWAR
eukprot:1204613-Pyramimonas_sp.AAC.1